MGSGGGSDGARQEGMFLTLIRSAFSAGWAGCTVRNKRVMGFW